MGVVGEENRTQEVRVTGFDIPFGDMVTFLVKCSIAVIPAALILAVFGMFLAVFIGALGK